MAMLREARKKELRAHIFATAIGLFQQKGYDQVTVDEIASTCGIAKGTFFNYFQRKEQVLLHLGSTQLERMKDVIRTHRAKEPKEQLREVFRDLLTAYLEHSDLLKMTLSETMRSAFALKEDSGNLKQFQYAIRSMVFEAQKLSLR